PFMCWKPVRGSTSYLKIEWANRALQRLPLPTESSSFVRRNDLSRSGKRPDEQDMVIRNTRELVSALPKINRFGIYELTNQAKAAWQIESL
ncbi:MAG: hypothetical protein P8M20_11635, partial [Planctomycetaceae bacterium]|nr:hypothetical protein [Planctomycetaceae bacterium]